MTFPASSPSRKFFRSLALTAIVALTACAGTEDRESHHRPVSLSASKFEWAVQHYEAGEYSRAITSFEALRKDGASVPNYDLISFYLGMSHFRLGHSETAAQELEAYIRTGATGQESQDARIALLLTYEKLSRWKDMASLAMESDKLTLFQNNRALLKLVWARALREQGELMGAKTALEEALPYLDKVGSEDGAQAYFADPDQDLWGRYHFTSLLVAETECASLLPKELAVVPAAKAAKGKKQPAPKKKPARIAKRLYAPWLEARTDCLRKAITAASEDLFPQDSPWSEPAVASLMQGNGDFGDRIQAFL
ncbi:MAG: tetratricopeptide repeat protein, partial [Bdellovibrionota bacterium]